ncbi:MAG: SEC-C metal-binding domain-containing protein [Pseudomonadota bacterium]
MASARKRHVGRNDACPCGSGKKYKRCCLRGGPGASGERAAALDGLPAEARPAAAAFTRGWSDELTARVIRVLTRGGPAKITRAFEPLRVLLASGGPLAHIRFDPDRFAEVVADAAGDHDGSAGGGLTRIVAASLPSLGSARLTRRLAEDASALVTGGTLPEPERLAAAVAALTTAIAPRGDYTCMPALEILFEVQLAESERRADSVLGTMLDTIQSALGRGVTLSALTEKLTREHPDIVERISRSPLLRRFALSRADLACDRVDRLIEREDLPPMLTCAELVRLTVWMVLADARRTYAAETSDPARERAVLTAMAPAVADRMVEMANREDLPDDVRDQYRDLAQALVAMPERCIMEAFQQAAHCSPLCRHARELELARGLSLTALQQPGALDELRGFMEELGDTQAVETLDQAQRDLGALEALAPGHLARLAASET